MTKQIRILQASDLESIHQFEQKLLSCRVEDQVEREFISWNAPWRKESLEHYLPLGWSFGVFEPELKGYFIAQPQLFTRGFTQSLWLEHISFETTSLEEELIDIARRLCREKHFQMLYVNASNGEIQAIKTAKF